MKCDYLSDLHSPILFRGNETVAYRDPTAFWHNNTLYLFFTHVITKPDGSVYLQVAETKTQDLSHWSKIRFLTPMDRALNYSSPGNIVLDGNEFVLCIQSYCRENNEKYGNQRCRLFTMRSSDLENWSQPSLLYVKDNADEAKMGRMIDPFLVKHDNKWYCFFKQNGISLSESEDLLKWHYLGHIPGGENVCILKTDDEFLMFHSPENGIAMKVSHDLLHWESFGQLITLGQEEWPWAKGRITAGFVIDLRHVSKIENYIMFFHGSGPKTEEYYFDTFASLGIAWSKDLTHWKWPAEA